jgi:AcrR family transcriptional regulator
MPEEKQGREPDTERKILEAAAKVFMMKGKLGSSMQDIADEAGINRTLLHYYFRSKDKLFDTVFEKIFTSAFPAMVGIMLSDSPLLERLGKFVETYADLLEENPYLPVFIIQEIALNPARLTDKFTGTGFNPMSVLKGLQAEFEEVGLGDMDPRHLFANFLGMVLFPYIGRPIFQTLAFGGDEAAYQRFLAERKEQIPYFIQLAFAGAGVEKNRK